MKHFVATLLLSGLFFLSGAAKAQTVPVVDSTTYRQFFVTVTADRSTLPGKTTGSAAEPVISGDTGVSDRQLAHLKSAGLNGSDELIAAGILLDFRTQYDQLVTEYNNAPETLAGTNDATPIFLSRMENLVQATKYDLDNSLSGSGVINLSGYLQELTTNQPKFSAKSMTIDNPKSSSAALVNAKYSLKPALTIGSCTLTPYYNATMTTSPGVYGISGWGISGDKNYGNYFFINNAVIGAQPLRQLQLRTAAVDKVTAVGMSYSDSMSGPWTVVTDVTVTNPNSSYTQVDWENVGSHLFWYFVFNAHQKSYYIPIWSGMIVSAGSRLYTSGLTEGYSAASGDCSTHPVQGLAGSLLDNFACNGTGPWQSPTSWVSVVDSGSMFMPTTDTSQHSVLGWGEILVAAVGGAELLTYTNDKHVYTNWFYEKTKSLEYFYCPGHFVPLLKRCGAVMGYQHLILQVLTYLTSVHHHLECHLFTTITSL